MTHGTGQNPSSPRRVLLVGCGRIGARHLGAIAQLPQQFTLCGVVDPAPARTLPEGVSAWPALDEALRELRPALVIIASPSGVHAAHATAALNAGADVLCEKPLAMTFDEAQALTALARQLNRRLLTCYQMRLYPTVERARRAVRQGALGALHTVDVRVYWSRPQAYFDEAAWRGSRAMDGGVLLNQANHYIDLMTLLAGEPHEVYASLTTLARDIEAPDSATLLLRWPHAQGTFAATVLCHPENFEASITLLGARGSLRLGGKMCDVIERWEVPDDPLGDAEREEIEQTTRQLIAQGHLPLYHRVAHALSTGRPIALEDAPLSSARLLSAAARAHALRAPFCLHELY